MRILALTHLYPRNEQDNRGVYIRQMYARLAKRHEIRVLVPRAPEEFSGDLSPRVEPFSYFVPRRWSTFGHGRALTGDQKLTRGSLAMAPLYAIAARSAVARKRREADLVHAHFLVPNGTIAAAGKDGLPMVVSLHGSDVYLAEKSGVMARAARYAIRRAAAIVPCSDDLGRRVIALGAKPENVHVVPYGADVSIFGRATDPGARARVRAKAGVGERPMILFVGNLVPKKGVIHLVHAAAKVRAKRPDAAIVLVGNGPLRAELEAEAKKLALGDSLTFMGELPWAEVPAWYAAADAFVAPSVVDPSGNVDGLPNVVLEGMATGLPVVASRVAGIAMAVRHEETGLLVPPGEPEPLADALLRVLADPAQAKAWGARGREVLTRELTWEKSADRYDEIFEKALAASRASSRA